MKIISVVHILLLTGFAHGQSIATPPSNTTGLVGAHAKFNCTVAFGLIEEMNWEFNDRIIYSLYGGKDDYPLGKHKYDVTKIGNSFILEVKDLDLTDGGQYKCTTFLSKATAALLVLDKPLANIHPPNPVEGDIFTSSCEARFGGPNTGSISSDCYPQLAMFFEGRSIGNEVKTGANGYYLKKVHNMTAGANMHGNELTCSLSTSCEPFTTTSQTKELSVLYSVRNTTYTPRLEKYHAGSNLLCMAEGNPAPVMEWENLAKPVIGSQIKGMWLNITENMVGTNKWRCTARNFVDGEMHEKSLTASFETLTDSTIPSTDATEDATEEGNGATVYIVVPCVVGLAVFLGILVLYKFRKQISKNICHQRRLEENDQEEETPLAVKHRSGDNVGRNKPEETDNILAASNTNDSTIQQASDSLAENDGSNVKGDKGSLAAVNSLKQQTLLIKEESAHSKSLELTRIMTKLQMKEMDSKGNELLTMVKQYGGKMLQDNPDIFLTMVKKASNLIQSPHYTKIMQEIANDYKTPHDNPKSGPLDCLLKLLDTNTDCQLLFKSQKEMLSLIQILTIADNNTQSRTEMLMVLLLKAEYISDSELNIHWTEEIISTLKLLLENGADPTWIPEGKWSMDKHVEHSAQFELFGVIKDILWNKSNLHDALRDVLPLFLSKECTLYQHTKGSLLHALMDLDWDDIIKNIKSIPPNFFQHYKIIISVVLRNNPSFTDMQDDFKRTPLHLFIQEMKLPESILTLVIDIVSFLKSEKTLNMTDFEGQTVLHCIGRAFPMFQGEISQKGQEAFLKMVNNLKSESNTDIQDKKGHTVLHIIASKFSKDLPDHCLDLFFKLVKIFTTKSNIDIQENHGNTFLHLLAKKYPKQISRNGLRLFLELMKELASTANTNIQDHKQCTALHLIVRKYSMSIPNQCQEIFPELVRVLATAENVNIQDQQGNTILHILAVMYPKNVTKYGLKTILELVLHLASFCAKPVQDKKGCTFLHILMKHYYTEIQDNCLVLYTEIVQKCIGKNQLYSSIQDDQGHTALHILADKYPKEVSGKNREAYLALIECLANSKDIQDNQGCTALHLVAENYRKDNHENIKAMLCELIKILATASNIDLKDNQGCTVLHIITRKIFSDPSLGHYILPILPDLTTTKNVNAVDDNAVTPCTWIMKGKSDYEQDGAARDVFCKIEDFFLRRTTDFELAEDGLPYTNQSNIVRGSMNQHGSASSKESEKSIDSLVDLFGGASII